MKLGKEISPVPTNFPQQRGKCSTLSCGERRGVTGASSRQGNVPLPCSLPLPGLCYGYIRAGKLAGWGCQGDVFREWLWDVEELWERNNTDLGDQIEWRSECLFL